MNEALLPPSLPEAAECFREAAWHRSAQCSANPPSNDEKSELVSELADSLKEVMEQVHPCAVCGFWTDNPDLCDLCTDPHRDEPVLCVVKEAGDVVAIERSQAFRGRYHVLGGVLDPLSGVSEKDIRLAALWERLRREKYDEIILALGTSPEAETTAYYIAKHLADWHGKITRFASGIPVGSELEYVDPLTLSRSLRERQPFTL